MSKLVVDASIAVKWVVEEAGTDEALALRRFPLAAPDLLVAECANILWKKVRRRELSRDEALLAARLIERADLELVPTRSLLDAATRLAIDLDHPAYDCLYLALAAGRGWTLLTADDSFARKLRQARDAVLAQQVVTLSDSPRANLEDRLAAPRA